MLRGWSYHTNQAESKEACVHEIEVRPEPPDAGGEGRSYTHASSRARAMQ